MSTQDQYVRFVIDSSQLNNPNYTKPLSSSTSIGISPKIVDITSKSSTTQSSPTIHIGRTLLPTTSDKKNDEKIENLQQTEPHIPSIPQMDNEGKPSNPGLKYYSKSGYSTYPTQKQQVQAPIRKFKIDPTIEILFHNPLWNNSYQPFLELVLGNSGIVGTVNDALCYMYPDTFGTHMEKFGKFDPSKMASLIKTFANIIDVSKRYEPHAQNRDTILTCLQQMESQSLDTTIKMVLDSSEVDKTDQRKTDQNKTIMNGFMNYPNFETSLHLLYKTMITPVYWECITQVKDELVSAFNKKYILDEPLEWYEFIMHADIRRPFAEAVSKTHDLLGYGNVKKKLTNEQSKSLKMIRQRVLQYLPETILIRSKVRIRGQSRLFFFEDEFRNSCESQFGKRRIF
jgi:hypothetical protein